MSRIHFSMLAFVLGFCGRLFASDPITPEAALNDFKKAMVDAMKRYSTNPEARATSTNAARSVFDKQINDAKPSRPQTIDQVYQGYLVDLTSSSVYSVNNFQQERQMWVSCIYKVFETNAKYAKDKDEVQTTQSCFDTLSTRLQKISKSFAEIPDLRNEAEKAAKKLFDDTLNKAVDPPGTDALMAHTKNLSKADRVFPIKSPNEQKYNQAANSALKDAAKRALDRSQQSQKK